MYCCKIVHWYPLKTDITDDIVAGDLVCSSIDYNLIDTIFTDFNTPKKNTDHKTIIDIVKTTLVDVDISN